MTQNPGNGGRPSASVKRLTNLDVVMVKDRDVAAVRRSDNARGMMAGIEPLGNHYMALAKTNVMVFDRNWHPYSAAFTLASPGAQ